mmetsp:Transcript_24105/g.57630  ORF Transcript_24105/g.57630 Transcript_24105/m.57630 type:complete len:466 (-) Transcript_24105:189-1586(-)
MGIFGRKAENAPQRAEEAPLNGQTSKPASQRSGRSSAESPPPAKPAWSVPLLDMVKSQADQVRAVEKSMKRLTAKVDMIDAKSDEILLAMSVVLEQMQLQQQPARDYHGAEAEASSRLDQAVQRLGRYQSHPGANSVSRGASRTASFAREPKRTLSFSPGKERKGAPVNDGERKPSFNRKPSFEATPEGRDEKPPKKAAEAPFATLATLRPCGFGLGAVEQLPPQGGNPYRGERGREDDERSGVSSRSGAGSQKSGMSGRSGASFRSDGSRKGLRPGYASSTGSLPSGLPPGLPPGAGPEPPRRQSSGGRWTGKAGAAEDANERYNAQLQKGGRGASTEDVYANQRGELARLERCAVDSSPTVVSLAAASAAGLDPSAAGGAKVYSTSNGPSPYYARPLQGKEGPVMRDGYGKIIKEDVMAAGLQRKAELDQLAGGGKSGSRKSSFSRKASQSPSRSRAGSASRC